MRHATQEPPGRRAGGRPRGEGLEARPKSATSDPGRRPIADAGLEASP